MLLKNSNKPFHRHWLLQDLTLGLYVLSHYCHHLEDTFRTATRIPSSFISKPLELGVLSCSVVSDWLFAAPWTVDYQAPLPLEFSRQEYWSGVPTPGDLPDPGIKLISLVSPTLAGGFFTTSDTWEALPEASKPLFFGDKVHVWK